MPTFPRFELNVGTCGLYRKYIRIVKRYRQILQLTDQIRGGACIKFILLRVFLQFIHFCRSTLFDLDAVHKRRLRQTKHALLNHIHRNLAVVDVFLLQRH